MNFIRRYFMLIFVSVALLFGIQVPNFLDQYEKRVDAHLREVTNNLQYYQDIASKYHNNSLFSLIALHKGSDAPTYREEGFAIEDMYKRQQRFQADQGVLGQGVFWNAVHVIADGDRELLTETVNNYSYAVPLNQDAIVSGAVLAMAMTMLIELLFGVLISLGRALRPKARYERSTDAGMIISKR